MIRPAAPEDAQAIADLWNAMIRETTDTFTTLEKTRADLVSLIEDRPGAAFVADSGPLDGVMTFGPFRPGPGYAQTVEHSIVVAPQAQGRGVADALMTVGETAASAAGCHSMIACISATNARALRFHARRGYVERGCLPEVGFKFGLWLDLVIMQKRLSDPLRRTDTLGHAS